MTAPVGKKYLNVAVNAKVYDRVQALAKAAGMPAGTFATLLFEAAYAARCGETGDVALDTAVSRVALLSAQFATSSFAGCGCHSFCDE